MHAGTIVSARLPRNSLESLPDTAKETPAGEPAGVGEVFCIER